VEKTNESAFFAVLDRDVAKLAASQPSRMPLRYILDVGQRISLHGSALGKSLLGAMPREEARALLKELKLRPFTDRTVTDRKKLMEQIDAGRENGWYEARGEGTEGVSALAVSTVLNGHPVGISLAGPIERMDRNRESYLTALREVLASLSSPQ
jgi:DNA-binding IclR family transcriptional regulator